MNLFRRRKKEYKLCHDWRVQLEGEYEYVDNGDSIQLCNKNGSRVIYTSSFVLDNVNEVRNEINYLDIKTGTTEGYNLAASVSQDNEFLTIAITYTNPADEFWARSVIESAYRVQAKD